MKNWRKTKDFMRTAAGDQRSLHLYIPKNADPEFWKQIAQRYLNDDLPALKTMPSSRKARVQVGPIANRPHRHYFKQFFPRNRLEYIKQVFRRSRAFRDLKGTEQAASRGLPVPEIYCVIEVKKWGIIIRSTVVTREVEGAVQLGKWLDTLHRKADFRTKRQLMRQLGHEMARWHLAGMRHGDARDSNILCQNPGNAPTNANSMPPALHVEFCWLDNERSRKVFRKRDLIRNLVQLNMTRNGITVTDRMRFWETYWADAGRIYYPRTRESVLNEVILKTRKRWKEFGFL